MSNGAVGAYGAIGAVAAMANALKAMGAVVFVEPSVFLDIAGKTDKPVVVHSPSGFLTKHKYLTSYKGFTFFTKSKEALLISGSVEMIESKKIAVPEL